MYRICGYLEVTTTGVGGATLAWTAGWTDDGGAQTQTVVTGLATSARNQNATCLPVRAVSGSNITYATTVTGTIGAAQYALHIKLEKMD